MGIAVHFGVYRHLRDEVEARAAVLITAMVLDVVVLAAFVWTKAQQDVAIVVVAIASIAAIFGAERWFLAVHAYSDGEDPNYTDPAK